MGLGAWGTAIELCAISATITAAICYFAEVLGSSLKLVDVPDGVRKTHAKTTPLIGGLAILVPSLALSIFRVLVHHDSTFIAIALAATFVMMLIGTADDRHNLPAGLRLSAFVLLTLAALSIEPTLVLGSLHFGAAHSPKLDLGPFAIPVTALMIIGFLNAANMADGMDGQLLGSLLIWSALIARHLGPELGVPFLALMASSAVALGFNLRGKLFSGSAGSYAGSLLIGLGAIGAYHKADGTLPALIPAIWFWLPVLDCVRLMLTRALDGRSPFAADRNHFHHILIDRFGRRTALAIYLLFLGIPALAGEFSLTAGLCVLAVFALLYAIVVVQRQLLLGSTSPRPIT